MIIEIPDKNLQLEFPDNMPHADIEAIIQRDIYGQQTPQATQQAQPQGLTMGGRPLFQEDPMAASLGMFSPKALGQVGTEYASDIGLVGGGLIGAPFGPAVSIITSGMGYSAGKMVKKALQEGKGTTPQEDLKNLGLGAAYQAAGLGISSIAGELFAPFAHAGPEIKMGIEWLKSKKLPFSADVGGGKVAQAFQGMADWLGLGRLYTHNQRAKLAQGVTNVVQNIADEIGIPATRTPTEAGTAVAEFMQQLSQKGPYYEKFNKLIAQIPETQWPNTLQAIEALGKHAVGENPNLAYELGIKAIKNIYSGKRGKVLTGNLESLIENGGRMTGEEAAGLINSLWTATKYTDLPGTGKNLIMRLKEGFMSDMETMMVPGTKETLAAVRSAADSATHEALKWLENSQMTGKFLWTQLQGGRKIYTPGSEGRIESGLASMITPITKNDVLSLKDKMITAGREGLWDATKLAYLQKVFDNTVNNGIFNPKKYLDWYGKYGRTVSEVMPELSANLQQWANISTTIGKDLKRYTMGQAFGGIAAGMAIGGLEALRTGDITKLISVPIAFSTLAALGTMGPGRWGFLRNWALKETSVMPIIAEYGAKIGLPMLMEEFEEKQQ